MTAIPYLRALCLAAAVICAAPGARAETPMTGAEFEARVTGRTLTFGLGGTAYGIEQYLAGRRVIWAFVDGPCRHGMWYEDTPGRICFTYEHDPAPQCWQFFDDPSGLRARFEGDSADQDLIEVDQSPAPLICPGPDVGA